MRSPYTKIIFLSIFAILFVTITHNLTAQEQPVLDSYTVNQADGVVYLNWVLSSGFTCDGIRIYRSVDTNDFVRIGLIPGICGSPDFAVAFDFKDENPVLNTVNYYKLELGNYGFSELIPIRVFDPQMAYLVVPQPAVNQTEIRFSNKFNELFNLVVFDHNGQKLLEQQSTGTSVKVNVFNIQAGSYVFTLFNSDKSIVINGHLIVVNY